MARNTGALLVPLAAQTSLQTGGWWSPIGPSGGSFSALASHPQLPSTIYAGGWRAGVFKSEDGGSSWVAVGPTDRTVYSLAIDPKNPLIVYAGTYDGLFRSRDGGGSWSLVEQIIVPYPHYDIGPPAFLASAAFVIEFDSRHPTSVYLATVNDVFVSTDDGESFTAVQAPFAPALSFAIDPASSTTFYAGTTSQGIFRSQDSGKTWKNTLPLAFAVNAFTIDSSDGLYAVTDQGIYQRVSSGSEAWTPLGLFQFHAKDMVIDPDQTIFVAEHGSVWESHDRGVSWTGRLGPDLPFYSYVNKLLLSRTSGVRLYAATDMGVLARSPDGGWHDSSRGLNASLLFSLAVDDRSETLYAGTWYDKVHRSRDGGRTWERIEIGGDNLASQLLIDPRGNATLYVVTGLGAFQSHDGGSTWSHIGPTPPSGEIAGLALAPSDPRTLYLTLGAPFGDRVRLFKTVDEGANWDKIADLDHSVACLAVDPRDPAVLFLGSSNLNGAPSAGVMKSVDGGVTWTGISEGFGSDNAWVDALTFDPSNPDVLYAATPPALFKSTDGGSHWARTSTGLTGHYVLSVAVNPRRSSMVLAGTDKGIFLSEDAAQTWAPMNEGLIANASVRAIVFSPSEDRVRIATFGGGVFERLLTLRASVAPSRPERPRAPTTTVLPR